MLILFGSWGDVWVKTLGDPVPSSHVQEADPCVYGAGCPALSRPQIHTGTQFAHTPSPFVSSAVGAGQPPSSFYNPPISSDSLRIPGESERGVLSTAHALLAPLVFLGAAD